ncbi:MAG: GntR family transcriptional regulator [Firmicutes bacterium]|nr:GntR family transcriptional regulator [Bacillota bacterium]
MPGQKSHLPLYERIKRDLLAHIRSSKEHDKIPSEPELALRYGVSRGTVKHALDELVYEGVLYRVPRKGTFVAPPRILRSFGQLPSYSDDIRRRGLAPGVELVDFGVELAGEKVCRHLNLAKDTPVWKIERIRTADGQPVLLSTSFLPESLFPGLRKEDVMTSLYETLDARYGMRPDWAHDMYTARSATRYVASLLQIPVGTAVLYSERVSYLADGRAVEFALSYIRGDRYEIHIDINRAVAPGPAEGGRSQ